MLLDNNVPKSLKSVLPSAVTAYDMGWHTLVNGELLSKAEEAGFDVLVTLDRGMTKQQNLTARKIAIAVLVTPDQSKSSFTLLAVKLRSMTDAGSLSGVVEVVLDN